MSKGVYILHIIVGILLSMPFLGYAQSTLSLEDSLKAAQFTSKGNALIRDKNYDSALFNYKKAAGIHQQFNDWDAFFYDQFQIGYYLNVQKKYQSNIDYLDSIETTYGPYLSSQHKSFQRFYGVKSWAHFKLIELDKALFYFDILIDGGQENDSVAVIDKLYANYHKGIVYQRIGQYDVALKQMNIAKGFCDYKGECSYLGNTYNNLGIIYRNLGEYDRSAEFYKKALAVLQKTTPNVNLTPIYNNLGKVYLYLEKYDLALTELDYALKVLTDYTRDYYQVESALTNTKANVLIELGRFKEAQVILERVLNREIRKYGEKGPNSSETLFELGRLYAGIGDFDKSNNFLHESIDITNSFLGEKNDKSAAVNNRIGKNMLASNRYLEAAQVFQQSIISLVTEFNETDLTSNPSINLSILDRVELIEALYQKAEALFQLSQATNKPNYIIAAQAANQTATQLLEQVRSNMLYESSITRLSKKANSIYAQSIKIAMAIKGEKLNTAVFSAMENSKSYSLVNAIQQAKSLGYTTQLELSTEIETRYKTSIKILENQLLALSINTGSDSLKVAQLKQQLFAEKEAFEKYRLSEEGVLHHKTGILPLALKEVQAKLESNELLIEYFAGEFSLYAVGITNNDVKVFELGSYLQTVESYNKGISQKSSAKEFQQVANKAYQFILEPVLESFKESSTLIIIPDKQLGYISFDALVTSVKENPSFNSLDYLLLNYTLLQHQSAGLYVTNMNLESNSSGGYFGFAPDFSQEELLNTIDRPLRNDLQALPFAKQEVEQIYDLLGGKVEIGKEASESNFKLLAPTSNVLHIASHAVIDNEKPLYSKLVFTTGDSRDSTQFEDGNLYSFEIYGLRLKANLVTLSACNTGSGKLYEGEGIFSLGRAFLVAGASSVLTSLWEVSDQSTSQIMMSFYTNLKSGSTKPKALQKAKLAYIKKADGLTANPYYWAGFVYTGTSDRLYSSNVRYYWVAGLVTAFLMAIYVRSRIRKTSVN